MLSEELVVISRLQKILKDEYHNIGESMMSGTVDNMEKYKYCLLYTSPSPRDRQKSRMPSSA